jgi:hypothetical protein
MRSIDIEADRKMKWASSLLSPVLAFLTACAAPGVVMGADEPPAKPVVTDTAPAASASKPPLIVQNPDGTFTIQKEPAKEAGKDARAKKGLVIHPQVVVPMAPAPAPEKK